MTPAFGMPRATAGQPGGSSALGAPGHQAVDRGWGRVRWSALEGWGFVSFGDAFGCPGLVVSAFVVDGLGAVLFSGLFAARHHQGAVGGFGGMRCLASGDGCGGAA